MKKVLHYLYGLPPVRGGGLVKYALDLAKEEQKLGLETVLLVPGPIKKRNSSVIKIRRRKGIDGLNVFQIVNPLPIPMANGIRDIEWFTSPSGYEQYKRFLQKEKPDVIHIHSIMGIHKSFFEAAKDLGIKMLYTSHDYFGICPKTDFMKDGKICQMNDWTKCGECCAQAFGTAHLILDQSEIFRMFMQLHISQYALQMMINLKKKIGTKQQQKNVGEALPLEQSDYGRLECYYGQIWDTINVFHFNSRVAGEVFQKRIGKPIAEAIYLPVCNSNCQDHRHLRKPGRPVRISFLGNNSLYKGFSVLKEAADRLWKEKYEFRLNVYFKNPVISEAYMEQHEPYRPDQLAQIMENTDLIVVPSVWKETFGLVVLEALSYGVPVVLTENVGAKMLMEQTEEIGVVCQADAQHLYECLKKILDYPEILRKWNENICRAELPFSMEMHTKQMIHMYGIS